MSGALKKKINVTYTPGSPGVPGTPGSPARPAVPGHYEWQPVRYSYSGQPEYTYSYYVPLGIAKFERRTTTEFSRLPSDATGITSTVRSPLELLSAIVGRTLSATEAHYSEIRALVTIPPYSSFLPIPPLLMIIAWTSPWVDILERVWVPGTPAVPAVPPTPGVPGTPGTMARDFNIGWNAGARSVVSVAADCAYTFSVDPSVVGVVTGLNDSDNDTGYGEIDFAWYLHQGTAQVYENGVSKSAPTSFGGADTFVIRRKGGVVTYELNGVVFYTSAKRSTGVVFADASMYMGGDTITSASFGPTTPGGGSNGKLRALTGGGGKQLFSGSGSLQPLKGSGYGPPPAGYVPPPGGEPAPEPVPPPGGEPAPEPAPPGGGEDGGEISPSAYAATRLEPLTGGGGVTYAAGITALAPLAGHGSGSTLAPSYAIGAGTLSYVTSAGIGLTGELGTSDGALQPLWGRGSDFSTGESEGVLQPMDGFGGSFTEWSWTAQAELVMPSPYVLHAQATHHEPSTIDVRLPKFTVQAYGGATLRAKLPAFTAMATGVGVVVGRANATMPMGALQASGTSGSVGRIDATLQEGGFTLKAFSGGVVETILHDGFRLEASGTAGAVGRLTATMPLFELEAHGAADQVGRLDATMPMLQPVASGVLQALMPMGRLVAAGHAVVAVTYEAYAMNLVGPVDLDMRSPDAPSGREITRYTNFPFDQIVRHGDKYYGVSSTGLYLLGGDTDDGAPIPWAFRTATTDFGTIQRKTVVSAYVGGTVMPTASATIFAGEDGEITYTYPVPPSATKQNYRVRFGRGLKTRYFALEMADARGGDVRADSIDFEINTMTRAL